VHKFIFLTKRFLLANQRKTMAGFGVALLVLTLSAFDQPPGTKVWDFYTGASIQSSVAIGHNGLIYFGTDTGKLYSFYEDGRGVWEYPTRDRIVASPAIGADGTIYIGSYDGNVYALSPEGVEQWRFQANGPVACSIAVGPGGMLYFGSLKNRLFALRPDGSKLWDLETSSPIVASPSISTDGTIYAPSSDGVFAAVDARTGTIKWEFEAPERIVSSPAIAADGTIYFGCFDGHLYALSPEGTKKWTYATGGPVRGSPAVGPDGVIYFGSDDRQLYALAPDGFKKWTFTTGKWIRSTPAIAADGTVYVGSYDHSLYAVGPTGVKGWEFVTDANVTASPAIAKDGTVYFGSWNGRLYGVRGGAPLATGGWPRFRGNFAQSGYLEKSRIAPVPVVTAVSAPAPVAEMPKAEVKVAVAPRPSKSRSSGGNWWNNVWGGDGNKEKAPVIAKANRDPITKVTAKTPNRGETRVARNPSESRRSRSSGGNWWNDVWGGGGNKERARTIALADSKPVATVASDTVAVGRVTEIANARDLIVNQPPTRISEQTYHDQLTVTGTGGQVVTSDAVAVQSIVPAVAPTSVRSDGAIPMMQLIGGSGAAPVTSVVPARPVVGENRIIADSVQLNQQVPVKAVSEVPVSVVTPPKVNVVPPTTISGKLPMMPIINGAGRSSVPAAQPALIKKVIEFPASSSTDIKNRSFHQIEGETTTASVVVDAPPEPVIARTAKISAAAPQPKPQIDKLDVIERRLVPGYFARLLHPNAGPKQYGKPVPEIDELEVNERTHVPGYFTRLIKGDKKSATQIATDKSAGAENSAVVSVDTSTEGNVDVSTDITKVSKTTEQLLVGTPEIDELNVREHNLKPGYFKRLIKGDGGRSKKLAKTETGSVTAENSAVISTDITKVSKTTEQRLSGTPEIDELNVRERNLKPGYFKRMIKGESERSKKIAKNETESVMAGNSAVISVESTTDSTIGGTPALPGPEPKIIADSSDLVEGNSAIAKAWDEEPVARPNLFKRLFSRSSTQERTMETVGKNGGESVPEENPAVVSVKEFRTDSGESDVAVKTKAAPAAMTSSAGGRFDTKLALLEQQMSDMRGELTDTRRERDDLRRELDSAPAVAVPAPKPVAVETRVESSNAMVAGEADPRLESALAEAYGNKVSKMESHLISLNEELANARVERARLREDLANARSGRETGGIPVGEVRPAFPPSGGQPEKGVTVAARELDIPQPAWLSNEVRSVIANADPWEQPPGSTAVTIPSRAPAVAPSVPDRVVPRVIPNESPAVSAVLAPPVKDEPKAEKVEERRKPGFFSRLFGRDKREPVATPTTNVVIVPSVPAGSVTAKPNSAQLLGNDSRFGSDVVVTNFPRVPYSPGNNPGFIQPGAGNLTQLKGFPRRQPVIVPPPSREMDPTRSSSKGGIKDVRLVDSVYVPTRNAKGVTIDDLKGDGPVVLVVSPPDNSRLSQPVLDLRGMVKSRRRVAQVLVSVGGGSFVPAAGLENWSHQTPVKPGLVLVRVKAIDADGRESAPEERTYHFNSSSTLAVEVVGDGRINPDLNGRELNVGQPYELTAVPGPGSEFVGWSGGVTSASPTLRFMMNNNLWLRAQFRPRPAAAAATAGGRTMPAVRATPAGAASPSFTAGRYTGLLYPSDTLRADRCGYFEVEVGSDLSYVGTIRVANSVAELRGQFDANGQSSQAIGRQSANPVVIRLNMDRQSGGNSLTGGFDADGAPVVMRAYRVVAGNEANPSIRPGRYTLVIPSPPDAGQSPVGDGFGEVYIDTAGRLRFQGELPDGTRVIQESQVSRGGVWPLYVPLYGGQGVLAGWISATNHSELDLYGDLRWVKSANIDDRRYPNGFSARRLVFGSEYRADQSGATAPMVGGVLRGGDLGRVVLGDDVTGLPLNAPTRETIEKFSFNVNPTSGLVEGTFIHPKTRQPTQFRGMHVQKRNWSSGYFLGPESSGMVHLQLK
jgi:outer membrane protein assembly factor BamB